MPGPQAAAGALTGSSAVVAVIVIAIPFAIYFGWQHYKASVHERANEVVAQAQNTMSSYSRERQDKILRAIASVRSAAIRDSTADMKKATEDLELLLESRHSSRSSPTDTRVVYEKPKFLLHIQSVASPRADGQGYEWTTGMYFSGQWVTATREPSADGQVDLVWLGALPVRCLADQKYGPYSNSSELCPKIQQVGARFGRDDAEKLGCRTVISMVRGSSN